MLTRGEVIARSPNSFQQGTKINIPAAERLLLDIKEILDIRGIDFWLMFGTFIGAYRDRALIPWDEDIDLAYRREDINAINSCEPLFADKGILFATEPDAVLCRDGEHADLCSYELVGEKRRSYPSAPNPAYEINAVDFETPEWVEFLGQRWRIFHHPEKWLYYIYGPDWRIPDEHFHANGQRKWPVE